MSDDAAPIMLREVDDADLHDFYRFLQDPQAQMMTSASTEDGNDPQAFDSYWARLRRSPQAVIRTVTLVHEPDTVVGHIEKFADSGDSHVRYWIDRAHWGQGFATTALRLFLTEVRDRPIFARTARSNEPSLVVLERNGFREIGQDTGFDVMRGRMLDDVILRLT